MPELTQQDKHFMQQAVTLAAKPLLSPHPNPRVGCVIVQDQQVIGYGAHEEAGKPHAEVMALANLIGPAQGATAYVTLEPCHHQGKTPPCTAALLEAGIKRVVIGQIDPNPLVSGRGIAYLQQQGIEVITVHDPAAIALNPGFNQRMESGRPHVILKMAMSLDGKTALANGVSQWITGPEARAQVHDYRAQSDAILTGIGTVLADDPSLTARPKAYPVPAHKQPMRVVLDTQARMPNQAKLWQLPGKTMCYSAKPHAHPDWRQAPLQAGGLDLQWVMQDLGQQDINQVWVEAGAKLSGALLTAGLVDKLILYLAPKILGHHARDAFELANFTALADTFSLSIQSVEPVGSDWRFIATRSE